jgi:hypothetical protein
MLLLLTWAGIAFGAGPRVASQPGEATVPEPPGTIQAAYG